jgi:NADH-quinone oxidoreductase subunit A
MFLEYFFVFIFLVCVSILAAALVIFNLEAVKPQNSSENLTTYECGFQPFDTDLSFFEIRFYKIALVFLLFDLELMFLLP